MWKVKKISSNKERAGAAVREALDQQQKADKDGGRGYNSAASAVETALNAFGDINGHSVCIETSGDISADGRGFLSMTIKTIDKDVIVL